MPEYRYVGSVHCFPIKADAFGLSVDEVVHDVSAALATATSESTERLEQMGVKEAELISHAVNRLGDYLVVTFLLRRQLD